MKFEVLPSEDSGVGVHILGTPREFMLLDDCVAAADAEAELAVITDGGEWEYREASNELRAAIDTARLQRHDVDPLPSIDVTHDDASVLVCGMHVIAARALMGSAVLGKLSRVPGAADELASRRKTFRSLGKALASVLVDGEKTAEVILNLG